VRCGINLVRTIPSMELVVCPSKKTKGGGKEWDAQVITLTGV